MKKTLKVGFIGLDTSHVVAFAKLLNDPGDPNHLGGARVAVAFPGASADFELSYSRVEKFTRQLKDESGVEIVGSAEAVAERSDLVFIEAVDGRTHLGWFKRIASFARPTFIDKPFATSVADAEAILRLAAKSGAPVMSCSSLRYADTFRAALDDKAKGAIVGCDAYGPMSIEPAMPGLFWYGCHTVEMVVAAMGKGCRRVKALTNKDGDLIAAEWGDGRMASIRGLRRGHSGFGIVIHREKGPQFADASATRKPYYASLLEAILRSLPQGRSDVPNEEMLEVVRFIEAANESRGSGRTVEMQPIC